MNLRPARYTVCEAWVNGARYTIDHLPVTATAKPFELFKNGQFVAAAYSANELYDIVNALPEVQQ